MGVHDGHRQRLKRELLLHGADLHDYQVLELLLCYSIPQGDVTALSHALLARFGSLMGVFDALPAALEQVEGVGTHTATLLKLVELIVGRYNTGYRSLEDIIYTTDTACNYLAHYFRPGARNESSYLLCLDGKRKAIGVHKLGEGNVNATDVTLRRVLEVALAQNATGVIVAHNHVSGLALPSNADVETTRILYNALGMVGICLVDHIIFADGDSVSLRDSGTFAKFLKEQGGEPCSDSK